MLEPCDALRRRRSDHNRRMSKLPPLAAVRAFEAAARHLSFTKAAEELFVTQSAISRHIRRLEDWLGTELFLRRHRALLLTPEGERYRFEVAGVFRRLTSATERIKRSASGTEILNIHSFTTIAMNWLIPRMWRFQEANPDIELRLTAATRPFGQDQEEQVHGIIGTRPDPFEDSVRMFPVALIPVCAPAYCERVLPNRTEEELGRATLLHSIAAEHNWSIWSERAGFFELDMGEGLRFDSSCMTFVAAARGMGVAMAQFEFVRSELDAGTLVAPFPMLVVAKRSYYLSLMKQQSPATKKFKEWVLSEIQAQGPLPTELDGRPLQIVGEI